MVAATNRGRVIDLCKECPRDIVLSVVCGTAGPAFRGIEHPDPLA